MTGAFVAVRNEIRVAAKLEKRTKEKKQMLR